jgi:diguanylate cyclase (GGDEF)-like protein
LPTYYEGVFDADDLLGENPRRRFEQMLAGRCASRDPFALMLVDLDEFRSVTAQHGANVGDLLLFEVTSRLRQRLAPRNVVMRCGDSQFAVLVPGLEDIQNAERLAYSLIERLESSMTISGTRFRLTASIGITLFPQHGKDWKALLLSADTAAYDARTQGRGKISVSIPAVR